MASRGQRGYGHEGRIAMMGMRNEGRGSKIEDRRSKTEDRRPRTEDRGSRIEDRGSEIDAILDPRSSILDPRVALTALPAPVYTDESASEDQIQQALERVAKELRWSEEARGP